MNKSAATAYVYAKKAIKLAEKLNYYKGLATAYGNLGLLNNKNNNFEKSLQHYLKAITYLEKTQEKNDIAAIYLKIAQLYIHRLNIEKASNYIEKAVNIYKASRNQKNLARAYDYYGHMNKKIGDNTKALSYYYKSLALSKHHGHKKGLAKTLKNIGLLYEDMNNYDSALVFYKKASLYYDNIFNKEGIANVSNNIGNIYFTIKEYDKAIKYYKKALEIYEKANNSQGIALAANNLGSVYSVNENYQGALNYLLIAQNNYKKINDKNGSAINLKNIGKVYNAIGKYENAFEYMKKSLDFALKNESLKDIMEAYKGLSDIHKEKNEYKKAFKYYQLYIEMYDSLVNEEARVEIEKLNSKYRKSNEEKQIEQLYSKKKIEELRLKKNERTKNYIIAGIILISIFSIIIFISSRKKLKTNRKLKIQKEQIEKQKSEILKQRNNLEKLYHSLTCQKERIEIQRDIIGEKNQNITQGIKYAEMIQKAILPDEKEVRKVFYDSFVLYLPKDIVSGDFYFLEQEDRKVHFAAVDCTGHGVPGAFMSLVGFNSLSQVLNETPNSRPSGIISKLNAKVNSTLHQNHKDHTSKEGMDLAFCTYHKDTMMLEFSGAFNPLYIIRSKHLLEFKGDPYPVGISVRNQNIQYTNHTIQLLPGDAIYIFTDGFVDQFGGTKRKKFLRKRFKNTLLDISHKSMQEQKEKLMEVFNNWRGNFEQIDDILIMGIRVDD